jgi:hypothetical protein
MIWRAIAERKNAALGEAALDGDMRRSVKVVAGT